MFTPGSSALEAWQTNKVEPCLLLQASGWTMAGCPGSHVSECATVVAVAGVPRCGFATVVRVALLFAGVVSWVP